MQVHYEGIHRIDPDTGKRADVVDELQEAVVQCLDCMHDQPHLIFHNDRIEPVEDRWERMVVGTPWVASCTVTVQLATHGVPTTIRSQRSSTGSMRSLWKIRWGWSCMQSRHCTTASWSSSTTSARLPVTGSIRWMPS